MTPRTHVKRKAPYVYDKGKCFLVNIKVEGRLVFVGRTRKWTNAVILFNDTLHSLGRDLRELGPGLARRSVLSRLKDVSRNSDDMDAWLKEQG